MTNVNRKEKRHADAKRGIIEAARRVFGQVGVEAASMQQIAEEAGYGASSLYNYFSSKTDIVNAVVDEMTSTAMAQFTRPQQKGEGFYAYFESLITHQISLGDQYRDYFAVMVSLRSQGGQDAGVSPTQSDEFMKQLTRILESGMKQGAVRKMDPDVAAHLVQGALRSVMFLHYASDKPKPIEALLESYFDFIWEGLSPVD